MWSLFTWETGSLGIFFVASKYPNSLLEYHLLSELRQKPVLSYQSLIWLHWCTHMPSRLDCCNSLQLGIKPFASRRLQPPHLAAWAASSLLSTFCPTLWPGSLQNTESSPGITPEGHRLPNHKSSLELAVPSANWMGGCAWRWSWLFLTDRHTLAISEAISWVLCTLKQLSEIFCIHTEWGIAQTLFFYFF